ncbi:MAG: LLM class F420-dependent oxidoreductase [Frankiaceae bacterium]|jgi:F420-dependent oxidoreductase-like protein|nr:LLM class F420-dependent oxidoreductase [Frankiaceae bacterium]
MDLRIFTEPQQGASYAQLVAVAQNAERLGFSAFFRSDHVQRIGAGSPSATALPGPSESWVTLGGIARETSTIRLGTLVTSATFRHPSMLALAASTVDQMSGGRAELGLGAGWYEGEHAAYGLPFASLGARFDAFAEQLEIISGLWATPPDGAFSYAGRHYTLSNSPALPRPVQSPRPPIIIGGNGPRRTPALAARFADEFNSAFRSVEDTAAAFERVRAAAAAAGRAPESIICSVGQTICLGENDAEVSRRAARIGRSVESLRAGGLCGTPDQVREKIERFAAIGASRLYLQFLDLDDLAHLDLIGAALL